MPRDGSGIYSQPYPDVVSGTTIESTKYNGNVNDVELDLNTPRPIVAGGTGSNNAHDALIALHGEESGQAVTNYDTFPFVGGSFYSTISATGGPVDGHAFIGQCYVLNDANMFLEARDHDDGLATQLYVRHKFSGTWSGWIPQAGSTANLDARYVNLTGDVMTGGLTAVGMNSSASMRVWNAATPTTGTYYFSESADKFLYYDGANFTLSGGTYFTITAATIVPNLTSTGAILAGQSGTTGSYFFGNTGTKYLQYDGTNFNFTGGSLGVSGGVSTGALGINTTGDIAATGKVSANGYKTRNGTSGTIQPYAFNINHYTSTQEMWIDATFVGNLAYTSDYRIKKDVIDLPGMWDTVKALRPIKYTNTTFSPPSHVAYVKEELAKHALDPEAHPKEGLPPEHLYQSSDIEQWGFIAHELQETLTPSAATGVKDAPDTIQSPNPWTVIAALTKTLQEAIARIEALEAAP